MNNGQAGHGERCPFCGVNKTALHKITLDVPLPYRVVCQGCGAAGPWMMNEQEARDGWEKRYTVAPKPIKWRSVENGRYTREGD